MPNKKISRRDALKVIGAGGLVVSTMPLWACTGMRKSVSRGPDTSVPAAGGRFASVSPINRELPAAAPREFGGDNPLRPHMALWAKDDFVKLKGGLPPASESAEVVVVGGGLSGLFSAWCLRDLKPLVLEQAPRFGGNAKGESWNGIDYSIGAAYFMEHDQDDPVRGLFDELGLYALCRTKEVDDPVYFDNRMHTEFWDGVTDPARAAEFRHLARHFADMNKDQNGLLYPEIPFEGSKMKANVHKLDRVSFLAYVKKVNGGPIHPHIATVLEHYCWSTLGASMKDLSAAVALNAYAAEFGKVYVAPGGNSRLAERTLERLGEVLPEGNLRADCLVIDVRATAGGAQVTYTSPSGELRTVACKAAVLACPKFVVGKILHGIEPARAKAISELAYHPYLVANVCLNRKLEARFYDAYLMKDGKVDHEDPATSSRRHQSTDMVLATFASPSESSTVLTLYRPMPWRAARAELYAEGSYERIRAEFEREIREEILPIVNASEADIAELRIARWGHPLPVGAPGLIRNGVAERAHAPHRGKVFFVEQDNWMLAAIETCASEALRWAPKVREAVAKG